MKRFFIILILVHCSYFQLFSQGEIDEQDKLFYRNEKSGSISLTSTGWGINGRFAKRVTAASKVLYDIDFAILRHPKEVRIPSYNPYYSSNFTYGKLNVVFNFRLGYGKQKEIFRKFDVGGVSIRRFYSFGPTLSILKPFYYEVYTPVDSVTFTVSYKKYNDVYGNEFIATKGSFFRGFDELKLIPGACAKFGFCFEYSKQDKVLHAVEAGVSLDVFAKELPIMATKENYQFFISLFATYRFGKVYDPNEQKKKKKRAEDYRY